MKNVRALGLLSLLGLIGCAMQAARTQAIDYCEKRGKLPFLLASDYSLNPIYESASVTARCVDPNALVHTTAAFGVDMADFADIEAVAIVTVLPGSIAAKAGIRSADLVYEYAGREITRTSELQAAVADTVAGSRVPIKLRRNKKELTAIARF